jgi:hypothetical protein
VIEIGTFTGMGTLALAQDLQPSGTLATFDLLAWNGFADTWLAPSDFAGGRVRQVLHDISTPGGLEPHRALFESADLVFVDGPKDGITEANILANLGTLNLSRDVIVMFDDIRVVNMIDIWRRIGRPKMDLSPLPVLLHRQSPRRARRRPACQPGGDRAGHHHCEAQAMPAAPRAASGPSSSESFAGSPRRPAPRPRPAPAPGRRRSR